MASIPTLYPLPIRQTLDQWRARLRLARFLLWMPRVFIFVLACSILLGLFNRFQFIITNQQFAIISVAALLASLGGLALAIHLRQPDSLASARLLDQAFQLQERLSTTLELLERRIRAHDEIAARQIEDTLLHLKSVDALKGISLKPRWPEWLLVAIMALILLLLILLPNPLAAISPRTIAQTEAIESASEVVRDITEAIASDTTLSDEERQALLKTLQTTLETLTDPQTTPEEAFAAMSDVQSELQERAEQLAQALRDQQAALSGASDALRRVSSPEAPPENSTEEAIPALSQSISDLAQALPDLSSAQLAELADALSNAAQSAASADPNLSEALQSAADALREGDLESALELLSEAQERAEQTEQAQTQSEQTQSDIQELANEAEQSVQELAQAGQSEEGQSGPQGEEGNPQSGNSDSAGETEGSQGQGDNGSQPSERGSGSPVLDPNAQNSSQQPQSSVSGGSNNPGGSGDGQSQSESGQPDASAAVDQSNNPDGLGQGQFEAIYAPQRIGGEGGAEIILETDPGDLPAIEGEFAENPFGQSLVPYNQVFGDYQNAANRALDSGYVPLGLRDVIRDYFTSLQPGE